MSKIRYLPFTPLIIFTNLVSPAAYLIGYTSWFMASFFYPDHPAPSTHWYNFLPQKEQYQLSAGLGILATCFCLFAPSLPVAALWIYVFSNTLWGIAEYNKQQHPPLGDKHYSNDQQTVYLQYVKLIIGSSIVMAITPVVLWVVPTLAPVLNLSSALVINLLSIASLYYLGQSACMPEPTNSPEPINAASHMPQQQSYVQLSNQLTFEARQEVASVSAPNYPHTPSSRPNSPRFFAPAQQEVQSTNKQEFHYFESSVLQ